ncbi:proteasome maturation factor UMP1-domain-containing protein, partial [Thamnocephalis sphaerospora]
RLAPSARAAPATHSVKDTANDLGVHDTLRYGPASLATAVSTVHPLENRLKNWDETQMDTKMTLQRRMYGIHAPVRQLMERSLVSQTQRHPALPSSNLGMDILAGRDESIGVEDVLS